MAVSSAEPTMPTHTRATSIIDEYGEPPMAGARSGFMRRSCVSGVLSADASARELHCLLIAFCVNGAGMTESVDGWLRRSGERCVDLGFTELGEALQHHAQHGEGDHLMMIEDAKRLIAGWNDRHPDSMRRDDLLCQPLGIGVDRCIEMHETVIESEAPFSQIAIGYEIDRLAVAIAPRLMSAIADVCGAELVQHLSFFNEHLELGAGHAEFNRLQMQAFLSEHPDALVEFVRVGALALDSYGEFLDDCWAWAIERA